MPKGKNTQGYSFPQVQQSAIRKCASKLRREYVEPTKSPSLVLPIGYFVFFFFSLHESQHKIVSMPPAMIVLNEYATTQSRSGRPSPIWLVSRVAGCRIVSASNLRTSRSFISSVYRTSRSTYADVLNSYCIKQLQNENKKSFRRFQEILLKIKYHWISINSEVAESKKYCRVERKTSHLTFKVKYIQCTFFEIKKTPRSKIFFL